jgi:hypothetical protein
MIDLHIYFDLLNKDERGSTLDLWLSGYNTEILSVVHNIDDWRVTSSLHVKDLFGRFRGKK